MPREGRLRKLLLVAFGLALGLAMVEVALRMAGLSRPYLFRPDAELGWTARPGAAGLERHEGEAWVRINQAGFRDRDHPLAPPPGTFRVAILGDSYTDAIQVPVEDTYWWQLERRLGECARLGGRAVEVLSFGVRGYSTAQELLTFRRSARAYAPDLVVLAYYPENDLVENSPALSAKGGLAPFFVLQDGQLVEQPAGASRPLLGIPRVRLLEALLFLRDHSRVLQLLDPDAAYRALRDRVRAARRGAPELVDQLVTYPECYRPPDRPAVEEAWRITEALITAVDREVRATGAAFFLTTLSTPIESHPDRAARDRFAARLGVEDLFYSEARLGRLAAARGFPVLALGPVFQRHADETGAYLHGFARPGPGIGHWNRDGHRLAAERLASALCAALPDGDVPR